LQDATPVFKKSLRGVSSTVEVICKLGCDSVLQAISEYFTHFNELKLFPCSF
jgi:hypothetical protein